MWRATFFALLTIVSIQSVAAQNKLLPAFHFQHVKGRPGAVVWSNVVRDSFGFVWIGTVNGLERYDGYGIEEYRNDASDPHSLSSNIVTSLLCDSKNRLWVGTEYTGICLFDRARNRFFNFPFLGGDSTSARVGLVRRLLEDRTGAIWFASKGGVIRIGIPLRFRPDETDSIAQNIRFTSIPIHTPIAEAYDLCLRSDGIFVVGTDSGLFLLDPKTHDLSRPRFTDPSARRLESLPISCLVQETDGTFWISTINEGLFRLDWGRGTATNYRHRNGDTSSIRSDDNLSLALDPRGNLWVGSLKGFDLFSPAEGRCVPYLTFGSAPSSGLRQRISVDDTGTLWFIASNGVYWLSPRSLLLPHYALKKPDGWLKSFQNVARDRNGAIWCLSDGTLLQTEIDRRELAGTVDVTRGRLPLYSEGEPSSLFLDRRGNFWYAGWDLGLYKINPNAKRVDRYIPPPFRGVVPSPWSIAQGPGDSLWIGTYRHGVWVFDTAREEFFFPRIDSIQAAVTRLADGTFWMSTVGDGVVVHNPATGMTSRLVHDPSNPHSLSDNLARSVLEDPSGRIWVGAGKALNLWDPRTSSFQHFPNPGFEKALFAVLLGPDLKGRIWMRYAEGGTSFFDPTDSTYTNFDVSSGVCGSSADMLVLDDGRVLLTGWAGINIFHPDSLQYRRRAPPLVITQLVINDSLVLPPPMDGRTGGMQLRYDQNVLELTFAATDIDAPDLVRYAYMLGGLEREWVYPKDRRYVRYTALPPGDYTFSVRATSTWREWPDQEIAFPFSITPPWWQTAWAYLGYGVLLAGLLLSIYRVRLQQIRLKQRVEMEHFQAQHLAEVDRLKSRFFANISHEFRTPLTLVLGPIRKWREKNSGEELTKDMGVAERNAERLLSLVNQLLDLSKIEAGAMSLRARPLNIVPIVRGIASSFKSSAGLRKIGLEVEAPSEEIEVFVDREKLEKILSNLISNAFKFTTDGGKVCVSIRISSSVSPASVSGAEPGGGDRVRRVEGTLEIGGHGGDCVVISVRDTGIGIPAESLPHIFDRFYQVDNSETRRFEGSGIGLALVKELVDLHHGDIGVRSEVGKGTEFVLRLPRGRDHLKDDEILQDTEEHDEQPGVVISADHTGGTEDEQTGQVGDNGQKPIVLIVEDNADVRAYVRGYLTGYQVLESPDGVKGLVAAREAIPDLIISDVMMPGKDGYELCRELKSDERTSHVPVILLTAKAASEHRIEGLETGADDYLIKPFEPKELVARVKNLIETRRRLRERFSVPLKPGEVAVTSMDDAFLKKAIAIVSKRMGDERFGVDELGLALNMSRSQLHRKLTALTNQSAGEFIRYMRLHRAMDLLKGNAGNVAEIAYSVGFSDPSHFSRRFHEQFGVAPSDVRNGHP